MVFCQKCSSIYKNEFVKPDENSLSKFSCPVCGTALAESDLTKTAHGEKLLPDGSNYDKFAYPRPLFTVDNLIVRFNFETHRIELLLIRRKYPPFAGKPALCGGYVDLKNREDIETAAKRELFEETNVQGIEVMQLGAYCVEDPRDYSITAAFYALLNPDQLGRLEIIAGDDASGYLWLPVDEADELAFSHARLVKELIRRIAEYPMETAINLLRPITTMSEVAAVLNELRRLGGNSSQLKVGNHLNTYLKARGYTALPIGELEKSDRPGRPKPLYSLMKSVDK